MKTPRYLLGAVLLFWAWQTGYWIPGALMALALEGARFTKRRWELSVRDFERLGDFTSVLFLVAAAYVFSSNDGLRTVRNLVQGGWYGAPAATLTTARAGLVFVQWWPMIFFLFAVTQAYSTRPELPLSTFSLLMRLRQAQQPATPPGRGYNLGYPFFGLCLAGASIPAKDNPLFFPGVCLLLAWALWHQRSPRFSRLAWGASLIVALGLGFAGQKGLRQMQLYLENMNPEWLLRVFRRRGFDSQDAFTELGRIGRLKLSNRIVLRVQSKDGSPHPRLLREASFQKFISPHWSAIGPRNDFGAVVSESNTTTWVLLPAKKNPWAAQITQYLPGGRGRLALPFGTARLDELPVGLLLTNKLGAVRADSGIGMVAYDAQFGLGETLDCPPGPEDDAREGLLVRERPVLARLAEELDLADKSPRQKLEAVRNYFHDNFQYSTSLPARPRRERRQTPLTYFLTRSRTGHCEYFATATVLLLRQLGIPARYAVGYAVEEKSGSAFLVRERHAHAWCLAYVEGQWRDFDTTPPSWVELEAKNASPFRALSDLWSRLWFEFNRWRWGQTSLRQYVLWFLGLIMAVLAVQILLRQPWKQSHQGRAQPAARIAWPGLDSEFYLVLERLGAAAPRQSGEALAAWMARLERDGLPAGQVEPVRSMLHLHYRYRFDPQGITPQERAALRQHAQRFLVSLKIEN